MARSGIKPSVRRKIFERDNNQCRWCGTSENLTIDHIQPVSEGGTNRQSNLQTLCRSCNLKRNREHQRRKEAHDRKARGTYIWQTGFFQSMHLTCACCERVVMIADNVLVDYMPIVFCDDCWAHVGHEEDRPEVCEFRGKDAFY
jgi:hypothetical protein